MCKTTTPLLPPHAPSPASPVASKLEDEDAWIARLDLIAFAEDVRSLGKELEKNQNEDDVAHLNKLLLWINSMGIIGFLTMGFSPFNLLSIVCISTFVFCRWTMVGHHTCHGGYDKCHPSGRWHRFKFALGSLWRRWNDWFDWMMPEAWNVEHNNRHHYNLGEKDDPDQTEYNMVELRESTKPIPFKYLKVILLSLIWKWFYYAPNTYKELKLAKLRKEGKPIPEGVDPDDAIAFTVIFKGKNKFYSVWELFTVVIGPYLVLHFFVTPLPYLYFSKTMYWNAVSNLFWAELLTNFHSFCAIATNHSGDDMYSFKHNCRPFSGSFYLRQVIASVDFHTGNDVIDLLHGWLNYQIEHHLWPNLSMLSYQRAAPRVKMLCAKHGVPYVQRPVWERVKKTVDIFVGKTSMRKFPEEYELLFLKLDAEVEQRRRKEKESH